MLAASRRRILERLSDDDVVLDVGAWAQPFERADWVLDLLPHETRGIYGYDRETADERFTEFTWIQRDVCDREPWPFEDDRFDFAICSHTLEDLRDPIWVCSELARVARAGYVEVPSRLEEQSLGVHGPWAGWSHHHWLCEVDGDAIQFVFKPPMVHFRDTDHFPAGFQQTLSEEQRVEQLWWEGTFTARERVFVDSRPLDDYLASFVAEHRPAEGRLSRLRRRAR